MEFTLPLYENILRIHDLALIIGGGLPGILHPERVEAALRRPQNFIDYEEGCDIHLVCALLLHSIATEHPFTEGNKRTALLTALTVYQSNGVSLHFSLMMNDSFKDLMLWVVEVKPDVHEIAAKLKDLVDQFEPGTIPILMQKVVAAIKGDER